MPTIGSKQAMQAILKRFSSYRPHYRPTFTLALPVVLSQIGHMVTAISDNIMVGRVGVTELAAASFVNSVFINVFVFGIGFSYGLTPLVGSAYGEKDYHKTSQYFWHALTFYFVLSLLMLGGLGVIYPFLDNMGQPANVVEMSRTYFIIIGCNIVPLMLFQAMKQFTEGVSSTKPAMIITLLSNVINIIFNYLLIYGHGGFPAMGLEGAGWATLLSRIVMAGGFLGYILTSKKMRQYIGKMPRLRSTYFYEIFRIGLPTSLQSFFEVFSFTLGAIMMGWLGEVQLAAHQIVISLVSLTYMAASGISSSATIRVSTYYGQKDLNAIRHAAYAALQMVTVMMTFFALVMFLGRGLLPTMFTTSPSVITTAGGLLIIGALFQLFDGIQVVALGALRGVQDVRIPTMLTFLAYWVIALPLGYMLAFYAGWNETGIWAGYLAGLSSAAVLLFFRFRGISRVLKTKLD